MDNRQGVRQFRKKYKLSAINSAVLCEVLRKQGYTVIEFNGIADDENVASIIDALQLKDQIIHSKCFTYRDEKYRLVFLHEDLNEEERTVAFAHEEGHIWNKHMEKNNVFGDDVVQEYEANEFVHYLLKDKSGRKRRRRIATVFCAISLFAVAIIGFTVKGQSDTEKYTDNLYRTETGTKYHIRDCMYIRDKKDVYKLTREEFDSGQYEPCEACMPDER